MSEAKSPNRVAAGKRNRQARGPLTAAGLERLRAAARANRPWEFSTGPRTPAGKAAAAATARAGRKGPITVRAMRADLRAARDLVAALAAAVEGVARTRSPSA